MPYAVDSDQPQVTRVLDGEGDVEGGAAEAASPGNPSQDRRAHRVVEEEGEIGDEVAFLIAGYPPCLPPVT